MRIVTFTCPQCEEEVKITAAFKEDDNAETELYGSCKNEHSLRLAVSSLIFLLMTKEPTNGKT